MNLISKSWLELKPNENSYGNQEPFDNYYSRISQKSDYKHIPKEVLEQWIHPHHKEHNTLRNYSWLNFENIEFSLCEWSHDELANIYVIENFKEHYNLRASYSSFEEFCCCDEDLNHWKEKKTWKTPPIILDSKTLGPSIPQWSEIESPYQLVEGHTRLGYLQSLRRILEINKTVFSTKHLIYLMRAKD